MQITRGFASDNNSGVHPKILEAIASVNDGHVPAYGNDAVTEKAEALFRELFGPQTAVFFVFNGTAANVLSVKALTQSFNAVLCAESSHLNQSECGAPENFTGCKLITLQPTHGKITVDVIQRHLKRLGDPHAVQPKVISITQPTEVGTLYTLEEIKALSDFAHSHGMHIHVDGARFVNAACAMGVSFKQMTTDLGVDVLSFGGTKNGLLFGEAIVFLKKELARNFQFIRKQAMQLPSKSRFVAAQFLAFLSDDLWLKNAQHANAMAKLLERELQGIKKVRITHPVQTNGVFAIIPKESFHALREKYFFYVWDEKTYEVRWMTSFDTKPEEVKEFAGIASKVLGH